MHKTRHFLDEDKETFGVKRDGLIETAGWMRKGAVGYDTAVGSGRAQEG